MMLLLLAAALGCEPFDSPAFRGLVLDAELAADRGEADTQQAVVESIEERIECLTFSPPPRLWANFLVQVALTRFGHDADWQTPLTRALALRPTLDRGVGGAHPIARFQPTPPHVDPRELPQNVEAYVDGTRSTTWPDDGRPHLAQVRQGTRWRSAWSTQPAASFWTQPIPANSRWRGWVVLGGRVGVVHRTQRRSDGRTTPELRAPHDTRTRAAGLADIAGGISYDTTVMHLTVQSGVDRDGEPLGAATGVRFGRRIGATEWTIGPGIFWPTARFGQTVVADAPEYGRRAIATPMLSVGVVLPPQRCSAAATVGAWLGGVHSDARFACSVTPSGGWSVGLSAQAVAGRFRQADDTAFLRTVDLHTGAFLGWSLPRDK